jgi:hypothetical protein
MVAIKCAHNLPIQFNRNAERQLVRRRDRRPALRRPAQLLQGREVEQGCTFRRRLLMQPGVENSPILIKEVENNEDDGYRTN